MLHEFDEYEQHRKQRDCYNCYFSYVDPGDNMYCVIEGVNNKIGVSNDCVCGLWKSRSKYRRVDMRKYTKEDELELLELWGEWPTQKEE